MMISWIRQRGVPARYCPAKSSSGAEKRGSSSSGGGCGAGMLLKEGNWADDD